MVQSNFICVYTYAKSFSLKDFFLIFKSLLLEILKFNKKEDKVEGIFDKCLFVLRNLSSLLERLCALQSRVFDRFSRLPRLRNSPLGSLVNIGKI